MVIKPNESTSIALKQVIDLQISSPAWCQYSPSHVACFAHGALSLVKPGCGDDPYPEPRCVLAMQDHALPDVQLDRGEGVVVCGSQHSVRVTGVLRWPAVAEGEGRNPQKNEQINAPQ